MRYPALLATIAVAILAASCSSTSATTQPVTQPATTSTANAPLFGAHGFDLTGLDPSVKPCDDFYQYAVGKWRQNNPLPGSYARFGRFEQVADRNRDLMRDILEQNASMTSASAGSPEQKIGDFYASCMNETAVEALGLTPIQPELQRIGAITDRKSLIDEITLMHKEGYSPAFRVFAQNDYRNSRMIIGAVGAGSIGLPDRDYYLRDDDRFKTIRSQSLDHITNMLTLAGEDAATARSDADRVLAFETKLAQAMMPRVEMRKPENVYHVTSVADIQQLAPAIDWTSYFTSIGVNQQTLNVTQPNYLRAVNQLVNDASIDDWKTYLRWLVINQNAPSLTKQMVAEDFNFNGRVLSGQQEQQDRWKRCVRSSDAEIGQLVGQEYVRRNFTPQAKAKMNELIDNLVAALRADIPTLTWMSPQTKQAALAKLDAFQRRIGYPEKWRDYSALNLTRDSYAANIAAARAFNFTRNVNRIGRADDPNEWGQFTPPTVNASYNPSQNNITFPAGILQPPFYDPNADDAYNYGGIGTVIGHEMTHGFDDQGAKFDAQGNLVNWWTPEDLKNFESRTSCIANEYSEFNVAQNININGRLVTGEAVADLGGATLALAAYERSLLGKPRQNIDGFTPEQRFFLGFAQVWGENMAAQEQTRRALTDPHAQGPFRVNGTVANMPAFRQAWKCSENAKMVREVSKRCSIW